MRLDKYLKVSRLMKRRTVANEACDAGRILVNSKPARASYDVKPGDVHGDYAWRAQRARQSAERGRICDKGRRFFPLRDPFGRIKYMSHRICILIVQEQCGRDFHERAEIRAGGRSDEERKDAAQPDSGKPQKTLRRPVFPMSTASTKKPWLPSPILVT